MPEPNESQNGGNLQAVQVSRGLFEIRNAYAGNYDFFEPSGVFGDQRATSNSDDHSEILPEAREHAE